MFEEVKQLLLDTLNGEFTRDNERERTRKIIFWYDPKEDYRELINELEIENTEIIEYDSNSFWIRYHIENEELNKNIVIYLPFERLKGSDNELLDLETANSDLLFNPDSTTMRIKNLGLSEDERAIIKKYSKFFKNKKREVEFINFDIDKKDYNNIDLIITAILLNIKSIKEDDLLKNIFKCFYEDQKKFDELFKLGSEEFIYNLFNKTFGTNLNDLKNIEDIFKSLIFTYFASNIEDKKKIDKYGKYILKDKSTNVYIFVNSLMRDNSVKLYFERLANSMENEFGINELISTMEIEEYVDVETFKCIDKYVLNYVIDKLMNNIGEYNKYRMYLDRRVNKYWYESISNEYNFVYNALAFFEEFEEKINNIKTNDFDLFIKDYVNEYSIIDTLYRNIYFYYDRIINADDYIKLRKKIENEYIMNYMNNLAIKWSYSLEEVNKYDSNSITMQNKFYSKYIKPYSEKKDRIIIIISDALRYECAKELNCRLKSFSTKCEIDYMLGLVPSYTKLGMAALLPNSELSRVDNSDDILVDGMSSSSLKDREKILQKEEPDSLVLKYEEMYEMTKMDWKKVFSGKKVIYIYHNTIDSIGEHSENKIFEACETAIDEIGKLVKDLHTTFSGVNLFVTADHGFFYKRDKIGTLDKINKDVSSFKQKTRYSYSNNKSNEEGIISINLDYIFGENSGYVNIPKGYLAFSKQGNDSNYIHGGILPQEIVIPVIDFKSTRSSEESKKVGITYSSLTSKITNSITYLEFLQDNNVDDDHKQCRYLLHFEDEEGNRVSDECTIIANYKNTEVKNRFFKEKFVFKDIKYDRLKPYYLVIIDEETGNELSRKQFCIDIAFVNNFDF